MHESQYQKSLEHDASCFASGCGNDWVKKTCAASALRSTASSRQVAQVLTREDYHGNKCRAREVHRSGNPHAKDSPKRADAFKQMAKAFGVTVKDIFWTQGRYES
jgi:hypothetical protein